MQSSTTPNETFPLGQTHRVFLGGNAERLDFGGVHINEVSSYRADHMPYGGVKASGMGREGPRYVIEEMSETKIIIITV